MGRKPRKYVYGSIHIIQKLFSYHILYNYVFCQLVAYYIYLQYSKISAVQKYITNLLEYLHGHFLAKKGKKKGTCKSLSAELRRTQGRKIKTSTVVHKTSSQIVKSPAPTQFTILCLFFLFKG